jgi:signal peptidase I
MERDDVIFFLYPKDLTKTFMNRVIGLPEQTVAINNGRGYVDDELLEGSYVEPKYNQAQR